MEIECSSNRKHYWRIDKRSEFADPEILARRAYSNPYAIGFRIVDQSRNFSLLIGREFAERRHIVAGYNNVGKLCDQVGLEFVERLGAIAAIEKVSKAF